MNRFIFLWLFSGIFQYPSIRALLLYDPSWIQSHPVLSVIFHIISYGLLFFATPQQMGFFHSQRLWGRTVVGFFFWFPVMGWVVLFCLFIYSRFHGEPITTPIDDDFILAKRQVSTPEEGRYSRRERVMHEMDVMPLIDILAGDDLPLKRGAIESLAQLNTPEAIQLLLRHRSDPSMEVRFFITSALARIKQDYEEAVHIAKKSIQGDIHNVTFRRNLGKIYASYLRTGLLDQPSAVAVAQEAIYHFQYVIDSDTPVREAFDEILALYEEGCDWAGMLRILDLPAVKQLLSAMEIAQWRAKPHFYLRDFQAVICDLNTMAKQAQLDPQWIAQVHWWRPQDAWHGEVAS